MPPIKPCAIGIAPSTRNDDPNDLTSYQPLSGKDSSHPSPQLAQGITSTAGGFILLEKTASTYRPPFFDRVAPALSAFGRRAVSIGCLCRPLQGSTKGGSQSMTSLRNGFAVQLGSVPCSRAALVATSGPFSHETQELELELSPSR